jgi:TRAP-type C4-dicarboxylate transport system permease small subunit
VIRVARRAMEAMAAILFAAILLLFAAQIAMRFIGRPILWSDEVLVLLMIWCGFLTAALLVPERDDVAFDLVYSLFPDGTRRWIALAGTLAVACIFGAAAPGILDYIAFLRFETTNILLIPLTWAFSVFGFFVLVTVLRRLWSGLRLLGPGWRREIARIEGRDG